MSSIDKTFFNFAKKIMTQAVKLTDFVDEHGSQRLTDLQYEELIEYFAAYLLLEINTVGMLSGQSSNTLESIFRIISGHVLDILYTRWEPEPKVYKKVNRIFANKYTEIMTFGEADILIASGNSAVAGIVKFHEHVAKQIRIEEDTLYDAVIKLNSVSTRLTHELFQALSDKSDQSFVKV